jgi:hypothetical protein
MARGVLYVHSSPRALCPHIEWAAGGALDRAVNFQWVEQPVLRGSMRTEFYWEGVQGTGAAIASALRGWEHLRFEVTEDATPGSDGGRWLHTPDLGIFFAQTDTAGNVVIPEDRIRYAMEIAGFTASCDWLSGRPGTTSSRHSATRATRTRWCGCTRWASASAGRPGQGPRTPS